MHKLTGIPESNLPQVLEDLKFDGSRVVSKYQESDGTWTIIVVFKPIDDASLAPEDTSEAEEPVEPDTDSSDSVPSDDSPVIGVFVDRSESGALILTEADLIALWRRSAFPIPRGAPIVFGIRGCLPVDYSGTAISNAHEIALSPVNYRTMNCTLGIWIPGQGFSLYPGSTVPYGPWVESGINRGGNGVNQLGRGRYRKYAPGWHKRSEGNRGHWALLQECPITIQRTADDEDFDLVDRWEVGRIAGDNIHCAFHMGPGAAIPSTKYSSLGCQVVAGTVKKGVQGTESGPWKKFISNFPKTAPKAVEYVLFDGLEVQQMIKTQCRDKTIILRIGSFGPYVETLKKRLSAAIRRPLTNGPEFDVVTFQAVIDYQAATFGVNADDGIVGQATAEKLGFSLPNFDYRDAVNGGTGYTAAPVPGGSASSSATAGEQRFVTLEEFRQFTPLPIGASKSIYRSYVEAFVSDRGKELLREYGISAGPKRLAHFFGQAAHETGLFRLVRESLHYTTVNAVRSAWSSRAAAHSDQWIKDNLLGNPTALGDWAYRGRMGNNDAGDGYKYRGGGVFQLTGREAYRKASKLLAGNGDFDLEKNPELIEDPFVSLIAACAEWKELGCNDLADQGDGRRISRGINRGDTASNHSANGEENRIELAARLEEILSR